MIFFLFHLNQIQYIASVARTIIFEGEMPLEHKYICFKMSIPMSPLGRISNKFRLTVWTISMESLWSLNIEINKGGVRKVSQITIRHISSSYPQHLKVMCGAARVKTSRAARISQITIIHFLRICLCCGELQRKLEMRGLTPERGLVAIKLKHTIRNYPRY